MRKMILALILVLSGCSTITVKDTGERIDRARGVSIEVCIKNHVYLVHAGDHGIHYFQQFHRDGKPVWCEDVKR